MLKKILLSILIFAMPVIGIAQTVVINESGGSLETAFVKWQPVSGAESYNVYYTGNGETNKKIDTQLIRNYGTYFRADVIGIKAGNYTIKVAAVTGGVEGTGTTTATIKVVAHDRSGFAFANSRTPGAYNADGTPKTGAVILYITDKNKNTVSMDVTGATTNPCVGFQTILDGFKKGQDTRPLIIRMIGQIKDPSYLLSGDIVIENKNNASSYITLEGVGNDAVADGWGVRIKTATNIEVRNIGTMNCDSGEGDNIGLQQDNSYVWVHNCDFFYGNAGGDADQIKGDGSLDCKKSTYITFSYNHFWDSGKCNLVGLSEGTTAGLYITFHHNWYDHSDSRHPRVRYYSAHVYNNYFDGNAKYGVGSTLGSSVFVESNYFRNCKYPILTSMQGTDVYNEVTKANDYKDMPIFSNEDGGTIKAYNNYMIGQKRFVPYGNSSYPNPTVDFDAVVVTNRTDLLASSIVSSYGANTYNNFDTNTSVMYSVTPDTPEAAKDKVVLYAGRVNGGDFKWSFDNAVDDTSYAVNTPLKNAITNYKTSLVSVQGETTTTTDNGGGGGVVNPSDMIHDFTISGTTSTFYTITGSLSTSKGTVNYNGLTLTQCLKMESGTAVSFTATGQGTLTLVFNSTFTGAVKIDGISYNATAGIKTISLASGKHTITKGDSSNLYYIKLQYDTLTLSKQATAETYKLALYPNPVKDNLYLDLDNDIIDVKVYNMLGILVQDIKGSAIKNIDMSNLAKGNYVIKASTIDSNFQKIIIKE